MGIKLVWNEDAQAKKIFFKDEWQLSTWHSSGRYFDKGDNGIALITGEPSDLIVVDCDCRNQRTLGLTYFASLENGLLSAKNASKLSIDGATCSVDTRGDKGCIVVAPSALVRDGRMMPYTWISPLVDKASLPSMPNWCIKYLNANVKRSVDIDQTMQSLTLSAGTPLTPLYCQGESVA
ncbi:hypothetical protein B0O80DRAFT_516812 [Mortierella sp. GBAus27b]|nr:hypothetical protein B0O80DRAFT_430386 [Mortierella sp. GBAus27b]KAI8347078.1 hypothetical protein B0O80DRAFT_516812 [Mortierella sp. GBAus27b]